MSFEKHVCVSFHVNLVNLVNFFCNVLIFSTSVFSIGCNLVYRV